MLQIVRKSVRIPKMARYLVEQCGLISWSSCAVSSLSWSQCRRNSFVELTVILEVFAPIIKYSINNSQAFVSLLFYLSLDYLRCWRKYIFLFLKDQSAILYGCE